MKFLIYVTFLVSIFNNNIFSSAPAAHQSLPEGVHQYLNNLPKIGKPVSENPAEKSRLITNYLLTLGQYPLNIAGRDTVENKIHHCIVHQKPIIRIMPGFPVSSGNPGKIPFSDEHSFSLGDYVALRTQQHISQEIGSIHAPGSTLEIYQDPYIDDLNTVSQHKLGRPLFSEHRMKSYQSGLCSAVRLLEPQVTLGSLNMKQAYAQDQYRNMKVNLDEGCIKELKLFVEDEIDHEDINKAHEQKRFQEVIADPNNGLPNKTLDELKSDKHTKRMLESKLQLRKHKKDAALILAQVVYVGREKVATILRQQAPDYDDKLRMSIHGNPRSVEAKIKTPMIVGSNGTPGHNPLVVTQAGVKLASRKELKTSPHTQKSCMVTDLKLHYLEQTVKG